MKRDEFPQKDTVFAALVLLFPVLYRGLESAIEKAHDYFNLQGREVNADLFPCLVRDAFAVYLSTEEFSTEFSHAVLPNNGVRISYNGYVLRFRMTFDGDLPVPGRSKTLQNFYQQEISWEPAVLRQLELPFPLLREEFNLVVLWQVSRGYIFEQLLLAAPKDAGEDWVEAYWIEPVPYLDRQSIQISKELLETDLDASDEFIALDDGNFIEIEGGQVELGEDDTASNTGSGRTND